MDYFGKELPTSQASVDLEAGRSYYFEVYHMDTGGEGYFELAVEIPNSDPQALRQVYQVDRIITNATVQPEEVMYSMIGSEVPAGSKLELSITRVNGNLEITYNKRVNLTYGCSASTFKAAIDAFDTFGGFWTSVTRKIYDINDVELPDTTGAHRIDYLVSVYKLRPGSKINDPFKTTPYDGFNATFTKTSVTPHSPLISGTFQLSIGGVPILDNNQSPDLPYDLSAENMQKYIRNSGIVGI